MIHESSPWKAALAKDAELIERWSSRPGLSERRSFIVERKVFLAAYALRKLDDAVKLSTSTLADRLPVNRYPPLKPGYDELNNHRFEEHFDLGAPKSERMQARRLINVIIHSLVYIECIGDHQTYDGFIVTSDFERETGLVEVHIPTFLSLMRRAAADYPTVFRRKRNLKTGRVEIWAGHEYEPTTPRKIERLSSQLQTSKRP